MPGQRASSQPLQRILRRLDERYRIPGNARKPLARILGMGRLPGAQPQGQALQLPAADCHTNDKLGDALTAFDEIINTLPKSESAFELAKLGLESRLRTERILNDEIAFTYINNKDKGLDHDLRKDIYEALPSATLDKIVDFQKANVAGRTYYYGILAKPENIDIEALKKLGKVVILTQEDIFGY